ncbi:alpha/beta-hydrolase [Hortaea werneckii]|nr:alpha/beta-hydrolase [Hortaea werneckii]KAI6973280.1 alpha/beta-hydrolase [Hortaea werneckii]KAI7028484.1 alpha/beta-hydrolase [Hortaea werneckii]KAI7067016.1 alpha/beta-hydrolase [Hortaea werneckii]KAI7124825.1 alpha/beta-hydrolase [Hortaea werneckii]
MKWPFRLLCSLGSICSVVCSSQTPLVTTDYPDFSFSEEWQVLEATWGADPLEALGGFRSLEYDDQATFRSSLASNGTVRWSTTSARLSESETGLAIAELSVSFPQADWNALKLVYGWAALQWQGWARGRINFPSAKTLALRVEHIMELWIDGEQYFGGDFYGYGRSALTLHLLPGEHRIDLRLVRDVRAMGGVGEPKLDLLLKLGESSGWLSPVLADETDEDSGILISDLVGDKNGPLASPYASATLRNDASHDIYIQGVEATHNQCEAELLDSPLKLIPGQTRPVGLKIACVPPAVEFGPIMLTFSYSVEGISEVQFLTIFGLPRERGLYEPQKLTYLHPSGIVSYAVIRPPSPHSQCKERNASLPILLQLHGAGLEADSRQVRHSLDEVPDLCAWVLFPTGVTPWSGDDWHTWGFADVEAAIAAIPEWIEQVGWSGPGVDTDRWLVSGHSNGGQGTWYALTHRPDKIIAAAPVSGYSSIQNYVPYTFWRTTDPGKDAVIQISLNSYRHELLLENAKGITILQQHGSEDDNVPPYHSRLLSELLEQAGVATEYHEMPGKPHWWDGVMTTKPLKNFYHRILDAPLKSYTLAQNNDFVVVSTGQGDMSPKNGVSILSTTTPGQLAKIHVIFDPHTKECSLSSSNVVALQLSENFNDCNAIRIDGQQLSESFSISTKGLLLLKEENVWQIVHNSQLPVRQASQQGGMNAVLKSKGPFFITYLSHPAKKIALQISRNVCQYFAADTVITDDYNQSLGARTSNLITVAVGSDLTGILDGADFPIKVFHDHLEILDQEVHSYGSHRGLAAAFVRPLPNGRLDLVLWGVDEESLAIAARLAPLMTGTGQPDFVVADRSMLWKGLEGTLALGFFDDSWNVSRNSCFS